ncbi:MAG: ABC transporter ATP-binding protein [Planctomycetota bacterium]
MRSDAAETWALLKPYGRPRLAALVLVVLLGMVTATAQSAVILLIQPVWSQVLFPAEEEAAAAPPAAQDAAKDEKEKKEEPAVISRAFAGLGRWMVAKGIVGDFRLGVLYALTAIALVLGLVGAATQYGFTWLARRVSFQMIVDLRMALARHLMGLSIRYHNQRRFGDLLSRVSSDVTTTLVAVNVALRDLLLEPLFALTTLVGAFFIAPVLMLGILVLLLLAMVPVRKLTARVRRGSRKSLTSLGASVQALTQMFQGIRTVKSFGSEERELARYREINEQYVKTSMRMVRAIAMTHAWTALYSVAGVALLMLLLGLGQILFGFFDTGGTAATLLIFVARFNNHIKNCAKGLTRVEESVGATARIQELLAEPTDVREAEHPAPLAGLGTGIRFEDVTFRYPGSDLPAIANLNLHVQPGETLALVGPSGAGKSTLVDLVARFVDPSAGRITVDGVDLRQVAKETWTARYALVGQTPFLFHASIGENIRYGKPAATPAEIEAAARAADIHSFIAGLPEGYETDVADMGARLSGGQRQRITIARAILKGAPLLLLDEATSSLDSESEAEVQAALDRLMAGHTVIVIAHRLSTVQNADRIAVLEEGRLVELGSHDELVRRGGTYARLSSLQHLGAPA